MRVFSKICLSFVLAAVIALSPAVIAFGTGAVDITVIISDSAAYLQETVSAPGMGQTGGDWAIMALMRSGVAVPDSYIRAYYNDVTEKIKAANGVLSAVRYSEYSRVALAVASVGANPRDVGGYDLLGPLLDYNTTMFQGINGPIFAILALEGAGFGEKSIIERYIEIILSRQLSDGGFALSGNTSDPDTTAMALTALSYYRSRTDVRSAINRALERLSKLQLTTGGFTSFSSTNSESVSQVIIALSSLGIPINDQRFVKNGNSLLDNLLTYYTAGQGFEHEYGGGASLMATEQALCALAALWRSQTNRKALYDMSDAAGLPPETPKDGLDGKHPDVNVPAVSAPGVSFSDIVGHENEAAALALAERGIINGYPIGTYVPEATITRAEFAAVIVRALGLSADDRAITFSDVAVGNWFYSYASAASGYDIIRGRSARIFDPEGLITRQEASVMIYRAAALCGLSEMLDDTAIRNILAQFTDYRTVASWATEAMAFCYYLDILDDDDIEIGPTQWIKRGEAAETVFRMLKKARLL